MGQQYRHMETVIRAIVLCLYFVPKNIHAQCTQSDVAELFQSIHAQLLEGSVQQAQGTLFQLKESAHCTHWRSIDYQKFSFYSAIYHHLRTDSHRAQQFFVGSAPYVNSDFGKEVQTYAEYFHNPIKKWRQKIHFSRFQTLHVDGIPAYSLTELPAGLHLYQLFDSGSSSPIHAQWFSITQSNQNTMYAPRHPPKWPLFLGGTQTIVAGFSFWMYHQTKKSLDETQEQEEYIHLQQQAKSWLYAGTGFSFISLAMFGVYYIW